MPHIAVFTCGSSLAGSGKTARTLSRTPRLRKRAKWNPNRARELCRSVLGSPKSRFLRETKQWPDPLAGERALHLVRRQACSTKWNSGPLR